MALLHNLQHHDIRLLHCGCHTRTHTLAQEVLSPSPASLNPIRRFAQNLPTESTSFHKLRLRRCSNLNRCFHSSSLASSPAFSLWRLVSKIVRSSRLSRRRVRSRALHTVPPNFRGSASRQPIDLDKVALSHSLISTTALYWLHSTIARDAWSSSGHSAAQDCRLILRCLLSISPLASSACKDIFCQAATLKVGIARVVRERLPVSLVFARHLQTNSELRVAHCTALSSASTFQSSLHYESWSQGTAIHASEKGTAPHITSHRNATTSA